MWRFLKKLKTELPYDPAISLLGIHTEETRIERDTCTPMFITALLKIAKTWKQPRYPLADECIRKLWYIYTMEYSVQFSHSIVSDSETLWTAALQALSMQLSRQVNWSGLPFPTPGNFPNPGIEPMHLMPPASAGRFFTTSAKEKPLQWEAHALPRRVAPACCD